MKRVAVMMALGVVGILAGCGDGGIEFNGVKQVEQFPIRKEPIVHYNLPSEVFDPITGDASVEVTEFTSINLQYTDFTEQASPGHDLWCMSMYVGLPGQTTPWPGWTDNETMPPGPPGQGPDTPDWIWATMSYKTPGANWPDATVTSTGIPAHEYIAAWTLSLQNQWFLREVNGSAIVPAVMGTAPVQYEGLQFSSMKISIVEGSVGTTNISLLPTPAQREAIPVGPPQPGVNGVEQIIVPASNAMDYAYNGQGAPAGLLGASWQEAPAQNIYIEASFGPLQGVPAPPYFAGGGTILAGGGVYHQRFSDHWQQTTSGQTSTININDGVQYSYYLAVVGNHLIGYGLGLVDSAFALPGAVNDQEDIMSQSVVLDMTAFIAAGKEFNFVKEDLLRMQDVANGDFNTPGPLSTLPGTHR
jgi:hypothetical protein